MGGSNLLETIQGIKDALVRFHTTTEILAENSLETDCIEIIRGLKMSLRNQGLQHLSMQGVYSVTRSKPPFANMSAEDALMSKRRYLKKWSRDWR